MQREHLAPLRLHRNVLRRSLQRAAPTAGRVNDRSGADFLRVRAHSGHLAAFDLQRAGIAAGENVYTRSARADLQRTQ